MANQSIVFSSVYSPTFALGDIIVSNSVNLNNASLLVVSIYCGTSGFNVPFNSVKYNGINLTRLSNLNVYDARQFSEWTYYLISPPSGSFPLVLNTTSSNYSQIQVSAIGVANTITSSTPFGANSSLTWPSNTPQPLTLSGVNNSSVILLFQSSDYSIGSSPAVTSTSGTWSPVVSIGPTNAQALRTYFNTTPTNGNNVINFTNSGDYWVNLTGLELLYGGPTDRTLTIGNVNSQSSIGPMKIEFTPQFLTINPIISTSYIGALSITKELLHTTATRLLITNITNVANSSVWPMDGSSWQGNVYEWNITFNVSPQKHSDPGTQTPKEYNGLDILVGDWISNVGGGIAYQIKSFSSKSNTSVSCIVQDVDQFNTYITPSRTGNIPPGNNSVALVFTQNSSSIPILNPTPPNILPKSWQSDIISRFSYTNNILPTVSINSAKVDAIPATDFSVLSTRGNQIVDSSGNTIRLRTCTWYGFDSVDFVVHGLYSTTYQSILTTIAELGFNCIRLPFNSTVIQPDYTIKQSGTYTSGLTVDSNGMVNPSIKIYQFNPGLIGLNSLQVMDVIIQYAKSVGLYIILDNHRITAFPRFEPPTNILLDKTGEYGSDGWPLGPTWDAVQVSGVTGSGIANNPFTQSAWQNMWVNVVTRYSVANGYSNVIGVDLHNEPMGPVSVSSSYNPTGSCPNAWQKNGNVYAWANYMHDYFIPCAKAVRLANPNVLIIAEGLPSDSNGNAWWGGALGDVCDVTTYNSIYNTALHNVPELLNKVVYSPHDYGTTVSPQTWLNSNQISLSPSFPNSGPYAAPFDGAYMRHGTNVTDTNPVVGLGFVETPYNRVSNYPSNIKDYWYPHWGYLYYQNIAPIWMGEFGDAFGLDGDNNIQNITYNGVQYPLQLNADFEIQWFIALQSYMNGYINLDQTFSVNNTTYVVNVSGGISGKFSENDKGMSYSFFSLNPEGKPLLGLLCNRNYSTIQNKLINLLVPILST